jgi:hypothetical protein
MNTDPTGTTGASPEGQPDDLSVIYKGGDKFLDRMGALGNAQHASEEAYQRLQIGTDAKAAYEDAKRNHDEALALRREAEKVLNDAKPRRLRSSTMPTPSRLKRSRPKPMPTRRFNATSCSCSPHRIGNARR